MSNQESIVIKKEDVEKTLSQKAKDGKRLLEPLKSFSLSRGVPLHILEDKNVSNDAEVHVHEADLWHCLEGEATFVCGGEMVDPWFGTKPDGAEDRNEIKAKEIRGGTTFVLKPGDWLYIPSGQPHRHMCEGVARLAIIKVPKT